MARETLSSEKSFSTFTAWAYTWVEVTYSDVSLSSTLVPLAPVILKVSTRFGNSMLPNSTRVAASGFFEAGFLSFGGGKVIFFSGGEGFFVVGGTTKGDVSTEVVVEASCLTDIALLTR